jgi:hypothetical protein
MNFMKKNNAIRVKWNGMRFFKQHFNSAGRCQPP